MPCCSFANPTSTPSTGLGRVWLAWRLMLAVHLALSTFPTFLSILLDLQFFWRKWLARLASSKVIQESDGVRCFARQKKQSTQSSASWSSAKMLIDVYRLLVNCYLDVKYEFLGGMRFPKGSGAGPGGSGKPCHGCDTSKDNWIPHMTANEALYWVCNGRYIIMWYLHREIPRAPGSLMRRPVSTVDLLLWKVVHSYQAIYLTRSTYFFNFPTMLGYIPALRDLSLLPDRHPNPRYPPPDAVHDASVVPTCSWPSSRSNAHRIRGDAPWLEKNNPCKLYYLVLMTIAIHLQNINRSSA